MERRVRGRERGRGGLEEGREGEGEGREIFKIDWQKLKHNSHSLVS